MHVNKAAIHMSTCTMSNTVSINMSLLIIRRWMSRLKSTKNSKNRYMGCIQTLYIHIEHLSICIYIYTYSCPSVHIYIWYIYYTYIHIYPHLNPHLSIPPHGCNVFCFSGSSTMPPGQIRSLTKAWVPTSEVAKPSPLVRYLGAWNPQRRVRGEGRVGWLVGPVLKEQKRFGVLNKKWVKRVNFGMELWGIFFF